MLVRIVADVVAERSFRFQVGLDFAENAKVRVAGNEVTVVDKVSESVPAEHSREKELTQVFGHGHDRGNRMGRGASDKDAHLEGAPFFYSLLVVPGDVSLDLVM